MELLKSSIKSFEKSFIAANGRKPVKGDLSDAVKQLYNDYAFLCRANGGKENAAPPPAPVTISFNLPVVVDDKAGRAATLARLSSQRPLQPTAGTNRSLSSANAAEFSREEMNSWVITRATDDEVAAFPEGAGLPPKQALYFKLALIVRTVQQKKARVRGGREERTIRHEAAVSSMDPAAAAQGGDIRGRPHKSVAPAPEESDGDDDMTPAAWAALAARNADALIVRHREMAAQKITEKAAKEAAKDAKRASQANKKRVASANGKRGGKRRRLADSDDEGIVGSLGAAVKTGGVGAADSAQDSENEGSRFSPGSAPVCDDS